MKVLETTTIKALFEKEWFMFLAINVFFPYLMVGFLQVFSLPTFRLISVLTCIVLILAANIHRIRKGKSLKALYVTIATLNVLSFPFTSGMAFSTSIITWIIALANYYEMIWGDGYGTPGWHGWPFQY